MSSNAGDTKTIAAGSCTMLASHVERRSGKTTRGESGKLLPVNGKEMQIAMAIEGIVFPDCCQLPVFRFVGDNPERVKIGVVFKKTRFIAEKRIFPPTDPAAQVKKPGVLGICPISDIVHKELCRRE